MKAHQKNSSSLRRRAAMTFLGVVIVLTIGACSHTMNMLGRGVKPPAESEFGLGPRSSAQGRYVATLQPAQPLRVRKLQTIQVAITDAAGQPLDGATIDIDGGMPQHGHGLPTRPRVTKNLGGGTYQIEGVRFNLCGWWEFKLAIAGAAGPDTVTFNIAL
ncbi:MAG TPA: FixH family protein [Thermoanaerobaculia bacterium]|nr:FixH family protein [Thermoanaerobaculia bacterium]